MNEDDINKQVNEVTLRFIPFLLAIGVMIFVIVTFFMQPDHTNLSDFVDSWQGVLLIGIVLFLLLREFVTWYWKQTRIVHLLEQIEENTRKQKDEAVGE